MALLGQWQFPPKVLFVVHARVIIHILFQLICAFGSVHILGDRYDIATLDESIVDVTFC